MRTKRVFSLLAALAAGGLLGACAGYFAFGVASDLELWRPQRDGFAAGFEAVGVVAFFMLVGAFLGACGGWMAVWWLIRRLDRSKRSS